MQKSILVIVSLLFAPFWSVAQVELHQGKVALHNVFEPQNIQLLPSQVYRISESFPFPKGIDEKVKVFATQERERLKGNKLPMVSNKRSGIQPIVSAGFEGAISAGIPNDNNMAINNDSFVVSVINSSIRVYTTSGVFKKNWNLTFFPRSSENTQPGKGLTILDRSYDPKIVFDPVNNRFIIVYLEGSESPDTRIIVAFSKTSQPLDGWNVYQIEGNPIGGKLWTDYPMIAINNEDLFITVNILKDNTDWRDGFTQSIIWQVPMNRGYNGDTLLYNLWSNIKHNNKPIWSICPVQESFHPASKGLYFISVRPGDAQNDTVFLHHISDNYNSGKAQYSYSILKTDKQYGLPPYAPQRTQGYRLQTNDARVLGAFYNNNKIQYVQTSNNPTNGRSSVLHSIIQYPERVNKSVTSRFISYDSLDIAYPTIVSAGNQVYGQQALITFSHTGESVFPGTSVVYFDNESQYSNLTIARKGDGLINSFLADTIERWGDYTSIQRKYSTNNEFWLAGSYGRSNNTAGTWISKIMTNDPMVSVDENKTKELLLAYPNPVSDELTIPFKTTIDGLISVKIQDALGKEIMTLGNYQLKGNQQAIIDVKNFKSGVYFYTVSINNQLIFNGRFSKI